MRIKATDIHGKTHWYQQRPNDRYVWGDESNASVMPTREAMRRLDDLQMHNRYLDSEDKMEIQIDRKIV